jgi:hypothetical protein
MLNLHVVPAGSGDCLLLEYGRADRPRFLLADTGADAPYPGHLLSLMRFGAAGGSRVDLVVASRPATDSRHGLPGFLAGLGSERAAGRANGAGIAALWHHTFRQTIGVRSDIRQRLDSLLKTTGGGGPAMVQTRAALGKSTWTRPCAGPLPGWASPSTRASPATGSWPANPGRSWFWKT